MPADLARVIRRCLEKDPDQRIQTARDIATELVEMRRLLASTRASLEPIGGPLQVAA